MDPLTHGLASLAMQRSFFPRASWRGVLAIMFAGVIADVDGFSASFGPTAYLLWHRTATHSVAFIALLAIVAFLYLRTISNKQAAASWNGFTWIAVAAASALHLLMDSLQSDSVVLLWPFAANRFSLDLAPAVDPWLLIILAAAILFPELVRLVSDEIGSRTRGPRGRNGAIVGLSLTLIYFGMRALFHGNVTASLQARTAAGETPQRVAAFPDSASPFLWHSVVETESAIQLAAVRSMGGEVTYATGVTTLRKPESSPILTAAQASSAAIAFLKTARFPKALVQTESKGYSVEIRDLKDQATESKLHAIFADIVLDRTPKVLSSELKWQETPTRP